MEMFAVFCYDNISESQGGKAAYNEEGRDNLIKIMLDAGHYAFSNQSPVVKEYYESQQMWKLAQMLRKELSEYGFEVSQTRDDVDKDLGLKARGRSAKDCDLFISLHSNAVDGVENEKIDRVEVYGAFDDLNNSSELGTSLAEAISECMGVSYGAFKTRKSGGGNYEYYSVLYGARSVGCPLYYIVEHSFHTNKKAALWLLDDDNLLRLARIEAATIAAYYGLTKQSLIGDVNLNGRIDLIDIMLVKRAILKTVTLTDEQKALADLNGNGRVDAFDYILLKKQYLNR